MNRKGVSPLIAAVLLIAFTMAVAAILTAWITSFTQEQVDIVTNESSKIVKCSFASLAIFDVVWTDSQDKLTVSIANTGTVDFSKVNVFAFDGDNRFTAQSDALVSADIISVTLEGVPAKPDRVRVVPIECPQLQDEETIISVG